MLPVLPRARRAYLSPLKIMLLVVLCFCGLYFYYLGAALASHRQVPLSTVSTPPPVPDAAVPGESYCAYHWRTFGRYDFTQAIRAWEHPPAEHKKWSEFGAGDYFSSEKIMEMSDNEVREFASQQARARYENGKGAYHNWMGKWHTLFHDNGVHGKHIMDFGSGLGIESLKFAQLGNRVSIADLSMKNLNAAERVLNVHGFKVEHKILVRSARPFIEWDDSWEKLDLFYSNGVLHHTPYMRWIVQRVHEISKPGSEMSLLLYSDLMWDHCMRSYGSQKESVPKIPPMEEEVWTNPRHCDFVVCADRVGHYADWYTAEKLQHRVGGFYNVQTMDYLTPVSAFGAFSLKRVDHENGYSPLTLGEVRTVTDIGLDNKGRPPVSNHNGMTITMQKGAYKNKDGEFVPVVPDWP